MAQSIQPPSYMSKGCNFGLACLVYKLCPFGEDRVQSARVAGILEWVKGKLTRVVGKLARVACQLVRVN